MEGRYHAIVFSEILAEGGQRSAGRAGAPLSIRSRGVRTPGTEWVGSQQAGALLACRREESGQEGWTTARLVWLLVQEENPRVEEKKPHLNY